MIICGSEWEGALETPPPVPFISFSCILSKILAKLIDFAPLLRDWRPLHYFDDVCGETQTKTLIYLKSKLLTIGTYCVGLINNFVIRTDNLQKGCKIEEENCQSLTYVILRNIWPHQ